MTQTKFVSRLDMADARLDREAGIIKGVSLVSIGDAKGYSQYVDRKTLEQVRDCAKQYKGGLRVKFNPKTFNHGDGGLAGRIPGDSLRIQDDQLLGDLHCYKNFSELEYLFEIAEYAPDNCGLSITFGGEPEKIGDKKFARCDEIFDATVVDLPAANKRGLFKAKDQEEDNTMDDETIKKLGASIAESLKPVLASENEKVITAFRAANGAPAGGEPSDEEKAAAGCAPTDTPEQVVAKVNAWRVKADKPVTMKDLMQIFRYTGGKPARVSGGAQSEDGDKDVHPFYRHVQTYRAAGMTEGKAISRARQDHGKEYNEWAKAGRPTTKSNKED